MLGAESRFYRARYIVGLIAAVIISDLLFGTGALGQGTDKVSAGSPASPQEISQDQPRLQIYLRRLFSNDRITVAAISGAGAEVHVGDRLVGKVERDGDMDLLFTFDIPGTEALRNGMVDARKVGDYLRGLLGDGIRVAEKGGDVRVYAGDEYIGAVEEMDGRGEIWVFIDEDDLPPTPQTLIGAMEPLDSMNATYFAKSQKVAVREQPSEDAAAVTTLAEDQRVRAIARSKKIPLSNRWYQLDFADGKPRYVHGGDLLPEKSYQDKQRYKRLSTLFPALLEQVNTSHGKLKQYMGFYTQGEDCRLQPLQTAPVLGAAAQRLQDIFWAVTSGVFWSDGSQVFRANVETGQSTRFTSTFMYRRKYNIGTAEFYRLQPVEPAGVDPEYAVTGFLANGKLMTNVKFNGKDVNFRWSTRCNTKTAVATAVVDYYNIAITRLPSAD